jgi:hypothetical protein
MFKGAVKGMPKFYKLGYSKLFLMIIFSLSVGAFVSKTFAEFLEDNEIFIPEDDD